MSEIDQAALDNVRALQRPGSPDLLARIVDIFVSQTPDGVKAITDALASAELDVVRTSAHSIKSSAAYVGATNFSTRMAQIERAARDENLVECQTHCDGLEQHCANVINELLALQDRAA